MINRRDMVLGTGLAGLAMALPGQQLLAATSKPMKILILGGTGFIGPHLVERALAQGHDVTLFNRGRSNTHLFPHVKRLKGDRDGGLQALKGGEWDAVLDNSGYVPRLVQDSAELLAGRVGRYLFTSTISVYDFANPAFPFRNGSRLKVLEEAGSEDVNKHYGELKVLCEQQVNRVFADAATIVRPTIVVGPGDKSQRFTWWVVRMSRGGDIVAPGNPLTPATLIDVRDLADFMLGLVERNTAGTYNAAGPAGMLSFSGMLNGIRATGNVATRLHWLDREFLDGQEIPRGAFPMWIKDVDGYAGGALIENQSSIDQGLGFHSLAQTATDTLAWYKTLDTRKQAFTRAGLRPEQEQQLLSAWRNR